MHYTIFFFSTSVLTKCGLKKKLEFAQFANINHFLGTDSFPPNDVTEGKAEYTPGRKKA